jgi:hypothetical protein
LSVCCGVQVVTPSTPRGHVCAASAPAPRNSNWGDKRAWGGPRSRCGDMHGSHPVCSAAKKLRPRRPSGRMAAAPSPLRCPHSCGQFPANGPTCAPRPPTGTPLPSLAEPRLGNYGPAPDVAEPLPGGCGGGGGAAGIQGGGFRCRCVCGPGAGWAVTSSLRHQEMGPARRGLTALTMP